MSEAVQIVELSRKVGAIADQKISRIVHINREAKYLALNALIEAARAGPSGRGFGVVANQLKHISEQISDISGQLTTDLSGSIAELLDLGDTMITQMQSYQGTRLADMSLNMIEVMDRNLYERSCDVRWWATDAAVVDALMEPGDETATFASSRLGVILESYTVYIDLWILDARGYVVANGRPQQYPHVQGRSLGGVPWFKDAMATANGGEYVAADVQTSRLLNNAPVATYATAIRSEGSASGEPIGVLAIFFDWAPQAQAIVNSVNLSEEERKKARCMLVDSHHRILASSDGEGVLTEQVDLQSNGEARGFYKDKDGKLVGYSITPGYETYKGMGWYGVIQM